MPGAVIQPGGAPGQAADMARVAAQLRRTRVTLHKHDAVFQAIADRIDERLSVLAIEPLRILDLGCRAGGMGRLLAERYPQARIVGLDPAPDGERPDLSAGERDAATAASRITEPRAFGSGGMVQMLRRLQRRMIGARAERRHLTNTQWRVAGDPHQLPFGAASFDLVVSNLLLPWCHAPHEVFGEVARVLDTGGAFMFSAAGPDTLMEYRAVWAQIDTYLHSFGLVDMHDLGDAMLGAGFAAPVLDRENLTVDYPSIDALQEELRNIGAANLANGRRRGLMAKSVRSDLQERANPALRFGVSLELVQGHGWKGDLPNGGLQESNGEYRVSFDELRKSLKQ